MASISFYDGVWGILRVLASGSMLPLSAEPMIDQLSAEPVIDQPAMDSRIFLPMVH
jgi:hypothetical protein